MIVGAALLPTAQAAQAQSQFNAVRYAFLSPHDYERDERFGTTERWNGDAKITFVTCAPNPDIKVNGGSQVQRDTRVGDHYLNSFVFPASKKRFVYSARAGTKETTGDAFYMAVYPANEELSVAGVKAHLPLCRPAKPLTQADIGQRFGEIAKRHGTSGLASNRKWAVDFEWYIPGKVMTTFHRNWGKGWGATSMIVWDDYSQKLKFQKIVGNLDIPEGPIPPGYLSAKSYPLQADKRMKDSGGGGFLAAATGAMMGAATGYAQSGGNAAGAIAGAMGGAVVGKAGGTEALYQQMESARVEATAGAEASRRELYRTIAQGERQGASAGAAATPSGGSDSLGNPAATAGANGNGAGAGPAKSSTTTDTRSMYLYAPMPIVSSAGGNPKCVSNAFPISFTYDPANPNARDPAAIRAAEAYFGAFLGKCAAAGKGSPIGSAQWVIDWRGEGLDRPRINPVDTTVTMP